MADGRHALIAPTRQIDAETEEMLRALGYLAPPEQRAEMGGVDPKDGMKIGDKFTSTVKVNRAPEVKGAVRLVLVSSQAVPNKGKDAKEEGKAKK